MCLPVASNSTSIFLPYFWVLILFCPLLVPTPVHSLGKTPPMSESPCVRRTSLKFGGSVLWPHHRQRFPNNCYTSLFLKFFSHLATRTFSLSYFLWGAPHPALALPLLRTLHSLLILSYGTTRSSVAFTAHPRHDLGVTASQ